MVRGRRASRDPLCFVVADGIDRRGPIRYARGSTNEDHPMDTRHFDRLTTTLSARSTRRLVLAGLVAALVGPLRPIAASTAASPSDHGNGSIVGRGGSRDWYHYRVPNPGE